MNMFSFFLVTLVTSASLEGKGEGEGGGLPCTFAKFQEKFLDFVKNCHNYIHLLVKFLI